MYTENTNFCSYQLELSMMNNSNTENLTYRPKFLIRILASRGISSGSSSSSLKTAATDFEGVFKVVVVDERFFWKWRKHMLQKTKKYMTYQNAEDYEMSSHNFNFCLYIPFRIKEIFERDKK